MFNPADATALVMLAALTVYVLLAGADFGAGVWDMLAFGPRRHEQRATIARAIGPVWEVNHIWIIIVVVIFFTGFPSAFAAVMTAMHVPLSIMLVGIVLRGAAFTFRAYDNTPMAERRWSWRFAIPSMLVPVLLGSVVGSLATGRIGSGGSRAFEPWYGVFPLLVGLFTLVIVAYLAAVYLTLETDDLRLSNDFRHRALWAACVLGLVALVCYLTAQTHAPAVYDGLQDRDWGFLLRILTGVCAIGAIWCLWHRRYTLARAAAAAQVALIVLGCATSLAPNIVPPDLTVARAAAPAIVHWWLLGALAAGAVVLVPSLIYLFRVFKRDVLFPARSQ